MAKTRTVQPAGDDRPRKGKATKRLDKLADMTPDDQKQADEADPPKEVVGSRRAQRMTPAERKFLGELDNLLYGKPQQHIGSSNSGPKSLDVRKLAALIWTPRDVALAKIRIAHLAGILPDPNDPEGALLDGAVDETVQLRALMHIDTRILGRAGTTEQEDPPPAGFSVNVHISEVLRNGLSTSAAGFVAQSQASARGHAAAPVSGRPDDRPVDKNRRPKGPRSK